MSWKKVKLGDILKQYRIEHRVDDKITYKQVSILNDGSVVLRGEKIGKEIGRKRQFIIDTKKHPNTLIFTRQLLLQGSIGIANDDVHDCIVTENMPMFSIDTKQIEKEFLMLFLKSEIFKSRIREIELSGSAQKSIHERTFLNLEFLLPPFELQKEIVVELLKLKNKSDNISTELTHQLTLVKKLRQQLLQDAVQGKLVAPSPLESAEGEAYEPASELLKKIKAAHRQAQDSKKVKELPPIKPSDIPFEIPENWVWCRLGEIVSILGDGLHGTPQYTSNGEYYFINGNNLINGKIEIKENTKRVTEAEFLKYKKVMTSKTVLVSINGTLGNNAFFNNEKIILGKSACYFNLLEEIDKFYIGYLIKGSYFLKYAVEVASETTIKNVSLKSMRELPIPLPPLAEQNRIVQKLDELMQYCNDLEASIKQSQQQNEKLLQQVLREALRAPDGKVNNLKAQS